MKNELIFRLVELIKSSNKIVFFGGAGTSTESGISGFRGVNSFEYEKWWGNQTISTDIVQLHHQKILEEFHLFNLLSIHDYFL